MKFLALFIAFSVPALADSPPQRIRFENRDYQMQRLGRTVWVSPVKVEMRATIAKGKMPECEYFESRLTMLKLALKNCQEDPALCRSLASSLYFLAENRTGPTQEKDVMQEKSNFWRIEPRTTKVDEAGLTAAAAEKAGVSASFVRLNLEPRALLKTAPNVIFAEDSFVRRVENAVKFDSANLATWKAQGLLTTNAFAACDILAGRAHFSGEAESALSSTDLTPDVVLDTAWKAYEAIANAPAVDSRLSPLAQAHKIGFYLGLKVPELAAPSDPLLDVTEVFNRFFEQRSFGLHLKEFGSKESMRMQIYPDQTYRVSAQHEWSL